MNTCTTVCMQNMLYVTCVYISYTLNKISYIIYGIKRKKETQDFKTSNLSKIVMEFHDKIFLIAFCFLLDNVRHKMSNSVHRKQT